MSKRKDQDTLSEQLKPNQPNIKIEQFISNNPDYDQAQTGVSNRPLTDNDSEDNETKNYQTNTRETQEVRVQKVCVKQLNMSESDSADSGGNHVSLPKHSVSPDYIASTLSPEQM